MPTEHKEPTEQKDKDLRLMELANSEEVKEYMQWRKWAQMFYKRILPENVNFNDTFKLAEEGYLKTNPKAQEYLKLTGGKLKL